MRAPNSFVAFVASEVDTAVFQDRVSLSVQRDGQRLIDAALQGDRKTAAALYQKYCRYEGLSQGGGGAGPGKIKVPPSGTAALSRIAFAAMNRMTENDS